jgi:hypothetical protein
MSIEILVMNVVKYETVITYFDTFNIRTVRVTDRKGAVTEFKMYHQDHDVLENKEVQFVDYRNHPNKEGTFHENVEATL